MENHPDNEHNPQYCERIGDVTLPQLYDGLLIVGGVLDDNSNVTAADYHLFIAAFRKVALRESDDLANFRADEVAYAPDKLSLDRMVGSPAHEVIAPLVAQGLWAMADRGELAEVQQILDRHVGYFGSYIESYNDARRKLTLPQHLYTTIFADQLSFQAARRTDMLCMCCNGKAMKHRDPNHREMHRRYEYMMATLIDSQAGKSEQLEADLDIEISGTSKSRLAKLRKLRRGGSSRRKDPRINPMSYGIVMGPIGFSYPPDDTERPR